MKKLVIISVFSLLLVLCACKSTKSYQQYTPPIGYEKDDSEEKNKIKNMVDWEGVYSGTIPCADCAGIHITLELKENLTYSMQSQYLGKLDDDVFKSNGNFSWNREGNIVTLNELNAYSTQYMVEKNKLIQLDQLGNRISGTLAADYVLLKADKRLVEKYWKVTAVFGEKVNESEQVKEPYMIFKIDGNKITGNSGCNTFSGIYQIKENNRITISQIISTKMYCVDNMRLESQLFQALEIVDNYSIKGDTLTLNRAKMAPLVKLEAVYK